MVMERLEEKNQKKEKEGGCLHSYLSFFTYGYFCDKKKFIM